MSRRQRRRQGRRNTSTVAGTGSRQGLARWRYDWLVALALLLATLIAYQPAWQGEPVWDDDAHITRMELRSLSGLGRIWFQPGATQQYYPIVYSVFWAEQKLWGDAPLGYHLINVFLHVSSAVLLVRILRWLEVPGAWLAGAIFALHPVEVESVAWISELKNTLSGLCYLGAALVYLKFDQNRKGASYFLALGLFVCGLACKTVIATLPAALLLVFCWRRGKLSWRREVTPLAPMFIAGIAAGLFTVWIERNFVGAQGAEFGFAFIDRCLIAGRAFWFYLGKLFWPDNLIFIYSRWHISQADWTQYLFPATAALFFLLLWRMRKRWRGPVTAFLYFIGTLFPVLGFVNVYPFRYSFVADHFQYLAGIGPIALSAAGIDLALGRFEQKKTFLKPILCAGLLLSLFAMTWRQCAMYVNVETLWRTTISRNPDAWLAHNNLGNLLLASGRVAEATAHFQRAVEINPDSPEAQNNLGNQLRQLGRLNESRAHLEKALEIKPDYAEAYNNLGNTLVRLGKLDEALARYHKALEIDPKYAEAHNNLGNLLLEMGKTEEAAAHFREALEINPNYSTPHYNLANYLLGSGLVNEAIAHFKKALEIDPRDAASHTNLGGVLLQSGRVEESFRHLQKALELDPGSGQTHNNMGNTLVRMGRMAEAVTEFLRALEIEPNNINAQNNLAWIMATSRTPSIRNGTRAVELAGRADHLTGGKNAVVSATLAAAYAECGRFPEAVQAAQRGLGLATSSGNTALADAIRAQIKLYQSGNPSREDDRPSGALPTEGK
jgi:tetratricopeptide (TPR) repeat protein